MNNKIFLIGIVLSAIFISGCADKSEQLYFMLPDEIALTLSDMSPDFNSFFDFESDFEGEELEPGRFRVFQTGDYKKSLTQVIDYYENVKEAQKAYSDYFTQKVEELGGSKELGSETTKVFKSMKFDLVGDESTTVNPADIEKCSEETFFRKGNMLVIIYVLDESGKCAIQEKETLKYAKVIEERILENQQEVSNE